MIHKVQHTTIIDKKEVVHTYEIDDLILLNNQPKKIQEIINKLRQGDISDFDNALIIIQDTGRILINIKILEE